MLSTAVPADIVPIPPSQLTAVASSQIQEWPAQYAVDGNLLEPGWHSASYSNPNEYLRVDVGSSKTIAGITYTPRQMASADRYDGTWNGVIKDYAILVSNSPTFPNSSPIAQGSWTWPNGWGTETVIFSVPVIGRYVYLVRIQAYGWYSNTSPGYASAGEVGILENLPTDDATFPKTGSCSSPTTIASSDIAGWEACRATDNLTSDPGWHNASYTEQYAFLRVDLGSSEEVAGVGYMPRQMNSTDINDGTCNGVFKEYEIYVTSSASTAPGDWGPPRATGTWTWPNLQERKEVRFAPVYGRYVIFRRKTAYGWYSDFNPGFASASEVWVYKRATVWLSSALSELYNSNKNLTQRIRGAGTQSNPFHGDFDEIVRSLNPGDIINLGSGIYFTDGENPSLIDYYPVPSTLWKAGQRVGGAQGSMQATVLKLNPTIAANSNASTGWRCVLYGGGSAIGMQVNDLTIDCNTPPSFTANPGPHLARNGVMLFGPNSKVTRVRVTGIYGNAAKIDGGSGAEAFGINLGSVAGNRMQALTETNKEITDSIVDEIRGNYSASYLISGQGIVARNLAYLPVLNMSQQPSRGAEHPATRQTAAYTTAFAANVTLAFNYCYGGGRGFWTDTGPMQNITIISNIFERVSEGVAFSYNEIHPVNNNWNVRIANNIFGIQGDGYGIAALDFRAVPPSLVSQIAVQKNVIEYVHYGALPSYGAYPSFSQVKSSVESYLGSGCGPFIGSTDGLPYPEGFAIAISATLWGTSTRVAAGISACTMDQNRVDWRMWKTCWPEEILYNTNIKLPGGSPWGYLRPSYTNGQ